MPGFVGLLHVSALLAADDAALHPEIEAQTETREGHYALFALRGLLELARNKPAAARESLQTGLTLIGMTPLPSPVSAGLLAVAAALIDPQLLRRYADKTFVPLFRRVETSMPLAAAMLAEALERAAPDPAPYRAWLDSTGQRDRLPLPHPRRGQGAVGARAGEPGGDAFARPAGRAGRRPPEPSGSSGSSTRTRIEIQPLEQSLQARGWTAGRPVALKRLRQGDAALDYLDDFDRRASRLIHRSAEGWYNQEHFECRADDMLPALVGHPRVFDARSPGTAVELVDARPELVLSSDASGFRLALSHAADAPGAFIEIETPGRWRVVVVDAKAVETSAILSGAGMAIPKSARARLASLARLPAPALPIRIDTGEIEDAEATEGDPNPVVRLSPQGDGLRVVLVVRPSGPSGPHFLPGQGGRIVNAGHTRVRRDLSAERRLAAALVEACPSLDLGGDGPEWTLDDIAESLELLDELRALATPPAMEWPEGRKIALKGEASFKRFNASVKSGEGWFAVSGTVEVDEGLVLDLRELIERMDGSEGRFVPLGDGAFLSLDRQFRLELERLSRLGDGLKFPAAAGVAVRDLIDGAASVKTDARWKAFVRRLDEAESFAPAVPSGFEAELRDYQREGFVWMNRLERWGAGALLADDMGLGKTVQAIAMMVLKAAAGPILVVAPTSVCGNWAAEIGRFAPGLRTIRFAETGNREEALDGLGPGDALIVSYGLLGARAGAARRRPLGDGDPR